MTADELLQLPRGMDRTELIGGILRRGPLAEVQEAFLSSRIAFKLTVFVHDYRCGIAFGQGTGYILRRNPDTFRAPDSSFVSHETLKRVGRPARGYFPGAPDLAVEVLSPDDRPAYVDEKTRDWFAAGTRAVWNIDPRLKTITVYRTPDDFQVLTEAETLHGAPVLPGFECSVKDMFDQSV